MEEKKMESKVTAYILSLFLLCLDLPGLLWLLSPSKTGDEEAVKIVTVVFVGGFVNLFTGWAGWGKLRQVRDEWRAIDSLLSMVFVICIFWMIWTFGLVYLKQLIPPL